MQAEFWQQRWQTQQIGFHKDCVNPWLEKYFSVLNLKPGSRVFLPLCGKTLDIDYLIAKGCHVIGAELSPIAVNALFERLNLPVQSEEIGPLTHYKAANIDLFQGDIFNLKPTLLGPIDAVYDRAALVALPFVMRQKYYDHLCTISQQAQQLLITFEYPEDALQGPPFSIGFAELQTYYSAYQLNKLADLMLKGELKGIDARECAWHLQKKST